MIDVLQYLDKKGLRYKRATQGNVHLACIFCNEEENKRGRLYISTEGDKAGLLFCFKCGEKGGINKLRAALGDPPLTSSDDLDFESSRRRQQAMDAVADYYSAKLFETSAVVEYLQGERGLTAETIRNARLGFADGKLKVEMSKLGIELDVLKSIGMLYPDGRDFFHGAITIPYFVGGHVSMIRGRQFQSENGPKYKTPLGQSPRLFNSDITFTTEGEVAIVESEFCALVLSQIGIPAVATSGTTAWKPEWKDYFSEYRRIFLMFDPDEAGKKGAERIAADLSPRARIVHLPPPDATGTKFDPTELYVRSKWDKAKFEELLSRAKGGLLKTPQDAFQKWKEMQSAEGIKFGFDALDAVIKPGLLGGQVFILGAGTNSGKSLILQNMMHRMASNNQDARLLYLSLEMTEHEWFERARRIYRFYNKGKTDLDALNWWKDRILIVDENTLNERKVRDIIEQFSLEAGALPDCVFLDYLGYWARAFKGEGYERITAAIMSLKAIAKEFRVPIVAPHQVSRGAKPGEEPEIGNLRDGGTVDETADFVAMMWAPDQRHGRTTDRTGDLMMRLRKSRHGSSGHLFRYKFAPISLAIIPDYEAISDMAVRELDWDEVGDDFETALWRHHSGVITRDVDPFRREDRSLMTLDEILVDQEEF